MIMKGADKLTALYKCQFCGAPTHMGGTKLCNPCWEAERHIEYIAKVPKLREKMLQATGPSHGFFERLAVQSQRLMKALVDDDKKAMWHVAGRIEALGAGVMPRED